MRANDEIGDDAFHQIEEELDWLEMAEGRVGRDESSPISPSPLPCYYSGRL